MGNTAVAILGKYDFGTYIPYQLLHVFLKWLRPVTLPGNLKRSRNAQECSPPRPGQEYESSCCNERQTQGYNMHSRDSLQDWAKAGTSLKSHPYLASSPVLPCCPHSFCWYHFHNHLQMKPHLRIHFWGPSPKTTPLLGSHNTHSVTYLLLRQGSLCNLLFYIVSQTLIPSFNLMLDFPSAGLCCLLFISMSSRFWKITWEENESCWTLVMVPATVYFFAVIMPPNSEKKVLMKKVFLDHPHFIHEDYDVQRQEMVLHRLQ